MNNNDLSKKRNEYTPNTIGNITQYEAKRHIRILLPAIVIIMILMVLFVYMLIQRKNISNNAEQVTNQMVEYIAGSISNEIDYAASSIKLSAITVSQSMTSEVLENPAEILMSMTEHTPFEGIEYIRADGMNVMNIGEPFDASDRVYYIEGIKGNAGIWNNYHPKTSKETLMNFYAPLIYNDEIVGVITGYIAAQSQIAPMFETTLYGEPIFGFVVDENDMVICSTIDSEYVKDLTLDMFMSQFGYTSEEKQGISNVINNATKTATSGKDPDGEGRISTAVIPGTQWKVVVIVPATSFSSIISNNISDAVVAIIIISMILISYAAYVLLKNVKSRKEIAIENERLEEENRLYNEANSRAFAEISEIRDIIASANMGTWRIDLVDGMEPRMYVDDTMKGLLGLTDEICLPERTYAEWYDNIAEEALDSVLRSVERMKSGSFDENTYLWKHPVKGIRYVRCGGTAQKISGGYSLRGYHYDVDEVVREDQSKMLMLKEALNEKNEYYSTLGTLGDIFYSLHVIDLIEDTVVEYNAKDEVETIVDHRTGASDMMVKVISTVTSDECKEEALDFTNLGTVANRMKNKKVISQQFIGVHTGWFLASFIAMDTDESGKPTKVIFATRVIDAEKKQEEKLIKKTQTDEMTGLLNRRAYEENIYEHNDIPLEDDFVYVSLDVNGLKVVNDTKGHMAGDELLIGACQCMNKSLGDYGKLYRIGGDEFVAILFCSVAKVKELLADFDNTIVGWSGKLVESLTISYGWISKEENPNASVRQLGAIAEQRMYEAKSEHYKKSGVDRRGQQDAHKALCALYTKILKINISDDTFKIINMDVQEQSKEMGFSNKLSEWLKSFGTSGHVHPDDLEEYLRATDFKYIKEYFSDNKTSLHVFYRRRYGDIFKKVMMEIIPADDYSDANQSMFMYVKDIDK